MSDLYFTATGLDLIGVDYLSVEKKDSDTLLRNDRTERIDDLKREFSNPTLFSGIIPPDPHLSLSCSVLSSSLLSIIPLSFLLLLPYFPHSVISISCLLLPPPGQAFLIMTFLLQRSWDTLRQRWERISVEFNLDLCFTQRQWNSSLFYRSVKYCPVP